MKTKALCKQTQQCWSTAPNIVGSWCVRLQVALIVVVPCFHGYNAPRRFLIKDRCKKASSVLQFVSCKALLTYLNALFVRRITLKSNNICPVCPTNKSLVVLVRVSVHYQPAEYPLYDL